ncbi:alpha/beta-hydrolase [Karstenula rhodostoma CBS 690.94]|uniref:Alpha/beta-hydrolase n=1 Tax=Karstenula rhodostoma CBS 690.94 TaxID=1392251 RepID=A0A9P4PHW2_9PLEO|nr:alpha/beta-hydrolase [Karstenula rhodostoma CBS 690.94]
MQLSFFISVFLCAFLNVVLAADARSSDPAVIMVPGAFHSPEVFEKVKRRLAQANYKFLDTVALPSVGHVVGRQPDIDAVKSVLYKHLNLGRDVVLVGNSYGCTVIGEAVKGAPRYSASSSSAVVAGPEARGRIISLVYLSGYIPTIQEVEHPETKQDIHHVSPALFNYHDNSGEVTADGDEDLPPQKAFYNFLPAKEADYWTSKLRFSSFNALNATATYLPYTGDFEVVYVIGSQDKSVPPAWAQTFIDQPGAKFTVEQLDADHVSMLSKPKEVTDLIVKYSRPFAHVRV